MQDLYGSHTVFVSARPARENEEFELRAICLYGAVSSPVNHIRSYMVELEETAPYIHMALSSNPSFSRAGRADTKNGVGTVQISHRYPPPEIILVAQKRKIVKKM